jgi:glycosyltransferase involved in cell wall biosynthesis
MRAPVAIFVYKRPEHTTATLEALALNTQAAQTDIFVFSDGPKSQLDQPAVEKVRKIVRATSGFASVTIIERDRNMGLANSIITGVTEILEAHENIIVLEDDLVSSPHFLSYMNSALENYQEDPHVFSVTGHTFPARFMPISKKYPYDTYAAYRCSSWSWGTWPDRWRRVDWDMTYLSSFSSNPAAQEKFNRGGQDMTTMLQLQHQRQIDSWAIRFCYAHHAHDMRCVYPTKTLIKNIGLDGSGTHCKFDPRFFHSTLDNSWLPVKFCPGDKPDPDITAKFQAVFASPRPAFPVRVAKKLKSQLRLTFNKGRQLVARIKNRLISPVENVDILVVNTYQKYGGAARAANRTFCAIRRRFPGARYLTLFKEDQDPAIIGLSQNSAKGLIAQRLIRLDQYPLSHYPERTQTFFSPAHWANPLRIPLRRYRAKLVHLHWVGHSMLRIEELARLRGPIVWTLHDTWAFTGGCHYTGTCEGFKKQCGRCPQLASDVANDLSRELMRRKLRAYEKLNITVVTPSRWLAEAARQSSLFNGKRIEVIPYGLDTETFKPIDHHVARQYLNLPSEVPVLLFGAHWLADPRKGGDLLCDTLSRFGIPCILLTFGEGQLPLENLSHVTVRPLGSLADNMSLSMAYSAADAFLCSSREDNLPNTVAEALACGTPCIAFSIGGLPEMIEHRKNGWLAQPYDTADFAEGIRWLVTHAQPDQLRRAAREKAVSEYSTSVMEERYSALYNDLLK